MDLLRSEPFLTPVCPGTAYQPSTRRLGFPGQRGLGSRLWNWRGLGLNPAPVLPTPG